jgi:RNA polymerase sigma factor (sigma-70 family)
MPTSASPPAGPTPDDWPALMAAAQSGDRAAYRTLLLAITPYVHRLVAKSLRDPTDIEDAVQDVLTTLHATRRLYDPARPFRPWLVGIVRQRVADRLRRQRRHGRLEVPIEPEHETFANSDSPIENLFADREALRAAVARLPAGQRRAIELTKLQEMSLQQAAATTGLSTTALKVATHRAIKRLRRLLGAPKGGEPA